jgi:hypothetical protein
MGAPKLGWIHLLPSEARNVIVKYSPKWRISCVIPAKKRTINARSGFDDSTRDISLEIPDLIFSHSIKKPWKIDSKVKSYFSLFAIDLKKSDGLYVTPFLLANVYNSGTVCFGETANVKNLRQANNYFWASPFNEDNCPYLRDHHINCPTRGHQYYDHLEEDDLDDEELEDFDGCRCACCLGICECGCRCDLGKEFFQWIDNYPSKLETCEYTKKSYFFCGDKYFGYPEKTQAVFLSNDQTLLDLIPQSSWRRDCQKNNVAIGVATKKDDKWDINLGSYQFLINEDMVTIL